MIAGSCQTLAARVRILACAWLLVGLARLTAGDVFDAAAAGDLVELTAGVEADPAVVQQSNNQGIPLLHLAISAGSVPCARLLLDRGADPEAAGLKGDTALHVAVRQGDEKLLALVLSRSTNVNLYNDAAETPLSLAIVPNRPTLVQLLLTAHADPNRTCGPRPHLPLLLAIDCCQKDAHNIILRALLAAGADLEPPEVTLDWPAGGNFINPATNVSILQYAALNGRPAQLQLLLDAGLSTAPAADGRLVTACILTGNGGNAEILLRHGGALPTVQVGGASLLHHAAAMRQAGLVAVLLDKGADPAASDRFNLLPIQYVADGGSAQLLAAPLASLHEREFRTALNRGNDVAARALYPYVRPLPAATMPGLWLACMAATAVLLFRRHRRQRAAQAADPRKTGSDRRPAVALTQAVTGGAAAETATVAAVTEGAAADALLPAPVEPVANGAAGALPEGSNRSRPLLSQWLRDKRHGTMEELFTRFAAPRLLLIGAGVAWFAGSPVYFFEPLLTAQGIGVAATTLLLGLAWLGIVATMLLLRSAQARYRGALTAGYAGLALAIAATGWSVHWAGQLERLGALLPGWLGYAVAGTMAAMVPVLGSMLVTIHRTHALSAPKKIRPSLLTADDYEVPAGWDTGKKD